jgi:hypothetical protein
MINSAVWASIVQVENPDRGRLSDGTRRRSNSGIAAPLLVFDSQDLRRPAYVSAGTRILAVNPLCHACFAYVGGEA